MRSALLALLVLSGGGGACAPAWLHETRESIREGVLRLSEADLHDARGALLALKPLEGERFADFLPRARAALVASSNRRLQALAYEIPDDPSLSLSPAIAEAMPLLVARWARLRSPRAQREALIDLVRLPTVLPTVLPTERPGAEVAPPDVSHDGRRAFEGFRDRLKELALEGDLRYEDVGGGQAWELHLQPELVQPGLEVDRLPAPITLLGHADVAAAPSFEPVVTEGSVAGPGVLDDKGPLVAAWAALAALQQSRLWLRRSAVLAVGRAWGTSGEGLSLYAETMAAQKGRDLLVVDGPEALGIGPPPRNEKLIRAVLESRRLLRGERPPADPKAKSASPPDEGPTSDVPFTPVDLTGTEGGAHWATRLPGAVTFWPVARSPEAGSGDGLAVEELSVEELGDLVEAYAFAIAKLGM